MILNLVLAPTAHETALRWSRHVFGDIDFQVVGKRHPVFLFTPAIDAESLLERR